MICVGAGAIGAGALNAGAGGGPAQSETLSFYAALPAALSYTGNSGGNRVVELYSGAPRTMAASVARIIADVGMTVEPAATNLLANSRLLGGSSSITWGSWQTAVTGVTIQTTSGSPVLVVTKTGHGLTIDQQVGFSGISAAGGITFRGTAFPYNVTKVVDADTFEVAHNAPATSTATSGSGSLQSRTQNAVTYPTGWSQRGATRRFRLARTADNQFAAGGLAFGAKRTLHIYGTGDGYLTLGNIAATQGEPVSVSFHAYGEMINGADTFNTNNQQLFICLTEKNSSNVAVAEQVVEFGNTTLSQAWRLHKASFAVSNAATVSVDVEVKSTGALSAETFLSVAEVMVSKTAWRPTLVLPAVGAQATAAGDEDVIPAYTAAFTPASAAIAFNMSEIVASADTVLSVGSLELRVVGASWPRDLVLTDGVSSVTLAGVVRNDHDTHGYHRVAVSWSSGQARLAYWTPPRWTGSAVSPWTQTASGSINSAAANSSIRFATRADGSARCSMVLKEVELYSDARDLTALQSLCVPAPIRNAAGPLPFRDFTPGRNSGNPLKIPGVDPTPAGWNFNAAGNKRIQSTVASPAALTDWDLRGFWFSPNLPISAFMIENCLFDDAAVASGAVAVLDFPANCNNGVIRFNEFYGVGSTAAAIVKHGDISTDYTYHRNLFVGGDGDPISLTNGGATVTENAYLALTPRIGGHPDFTQTSYVNRALQFERNWVDMRRLLTCRTTLNSALIAGAAGGTSGANITASGNVVAGPYNPVQFSVNRPLPLVGGALKVWSYASQATLGSNLVAMPSGAGAYDATFGSHIQLALAGAITLAGSALGKLGLVAGSYTDSVTGGGLWQDASLRAVITTACKLYGTVPSLDTTTTSGFAVGDTLTVNGQTITVLASGATGNTQVNQGDTLATLFTKLAALVPGLTCSIVPHQIVASDNIDALSGAPNGPA